MTEEAGEGTGWGWGWDITISWRLRPTNEKDSECVSVGLRFSGFLLKSSRQIGWYSGVADERFVAFGFSIRRSREAPEHSQPATQLVEK